jgi:hypothetical protein
MRKLMVIAAVAATCCAPLAALPAATRAQSLPPLPIPTEALVDATGQVFDAAGNLLGVVDSVTGLLIPASPSPPAAGAGSAPPSCSTSAPPTPTTPAPTTTTAPTTPAPATPTASTSTPAPGPRADTVAPGLSLRVTHETSYRGARRKGLRVTARCTEACRLTLRLTKGAQYAMLTTTLHANRTTALQLRLNKGARQVLAQRRRATRLTLRGQAVDAAGNRSRILSRTAIVKAGRR